MISLRLSDIDPKNISDEMIAKVLFSKVDQDYQEADCLLVFGCHLKPLLDERLLCALSLYKTKKMSKVLISGGIGVHGDFQESAYMKDYFLRHGLKETDILVEDQSTTTEENITNSLVILEEKQLLTHKRLVFVSSQAHLRRIGMQFRKMCKGCDLTLYYAYPEESLFSCENVMKNDNLKLLAKKEVAKICSLVKEKRLEDENI